MRELNDTAAQGRACGNLGNTYYLLGNFQQAIKYHQEVWFYIFIIKFFVPYQTTWDFEFEEIKLKFLK